MEVHLGKKIRPKKKSKSEYEIDGRHLILTREIAKASGYNIKESTMTREEIKDVIREMLDEMIAEERDYRAEYDNYHKKPDQKKNRAKRNNARRRFEREGRVSKGDDNDVDHKNPIRSGGSNDDHNLRVRKTSSNRSDNGQGK